MNWHVLQPFSLCTYVRTGPAANLTPQGLIGQLGLHDVQQSPFIMDVQVQVGDGSFAVLFSEVITTMSYGIKEIVLFDKILCT